MTQPLAHGSPCHRQLVEELQVRTQSKHVSAAPQGARVTTQGSFEGDTATEVFVTTWPPHDSEAVTQEKELTNETTDDGHTSCRTRHPVPLH